MQYSVTLDLASIDEWGLNMQQGVVFAYVYSCPSWCTKAADDPEFFNLSTGKMATELSALSEKRDTMLRYVTQLVEKGLLERRTIKRNQYLKLTEKGRQWNRTRTPQRDKRPVSQRDDRPVDPPQRDKHPAQRDKHPEATGQTSVESVTTTSGTTSGKRGGASPAGDLPPDLADAYHEHLPWGVRIITWSTGRRQALKRLQRSHPQCLKNGFWSVFFAAAAQDRFIRGEVPPTGGRDPFKVSVDYLLREDNFVGIFERAVDADRRSAA